MKRTLISCSYIKFQAILNSIGVLSSMCLGLIASNGSAQAAYLGGADAFVNTIGSFSSQTVIPGASVSASYTEPGGNVTSSANVTSGFTLQTSSNASNFSLSLPGTGSSSFGSDFSIIGNNLGITIPLTFNFNLQGKMELSFTQAPAFAVNNFSYFITTPATQNQTFKSVAGSATASFSTFNKSTSASGFLGSNIPLGINTLDRTTIFDFTIPFQLDATTNGFITAGLNSSSAATNGAFAITDFSSGLSLDSITVPQDFNLSSFQNLQVAFDSGRTLSVTQVGTATSVPEPFTIIGTSIGFIAAFRMRNKLKSVSKNDNLL